MDMTGLSHLVAEVKEASRSLETSDRKVNNRIDGLEQSLNELHRKAGPRALS